MSHSEPTQLRDRRTVLITGASSGIGAALARLYAREGARLFLGGRDAPRLAQVAEDCRALGAHADIRVGDVTARDGMRAWIEEADDLAPLDLVVANAGVSAGTGDDHETEAQARRIIAVNLDGMLNTVHPAIDRMSVRRRGQVALVSSMAGFRGFPGAPAYSASKAAVKAYGEALRTDLRPLGIKLSVVCPGFVVSRITAVNRFRMPFLMSADKAATIIARGLARDRARIAFPFPTYFGAWLAAALPPGLADRLLTRLPAKGADL